jgi:hypothetical protein
LIASIRAKYLWYRSQTINLENIPVGTFDWKCA